MGSQGGGGEGVTAQGFGPDVIWKGGDGVWVCGGGEGGDVNRDAHIGPMGNAAARKAPV